MSHDTPARGLWGLVPINSAEFVIFAFSFAKPATKRDWRSFSAAGLVLLASAWRVLYAAQREHGLAVVGPYAPIRHPQHVAFIMIMPGFLIRWPPIAGGGGYAVISSGRNV